MRLSRRYLALGLNFLIQLPCLVSAAGEESSEVRQPSSARPIQTSSGLEVELVPEMETPTGILWQSAAERERLSEDPRAEAAVAKALQTLRDLWTEIREIDPAQISRYQLEATAGWRLPEEPGELVARAVASDPETGALFVEIRGPRLPARYDIVFRHLYLYGRYDPALEELDRLVVTIRGWVEE